MRGNAILTACAALLWGCGARSDLAIGADASTPAPIDAGRCDAFVPPLPDAGRRDAGAPDAGPPSACTLEVVVEPTTIFSDVNGAFNAPQVELRPDGLLDFVATFLPNTDDRIPNPHGERFDLALRSAGLLGGPLSPTFAMFTGVRGDTLGVCYRNTSGFPELARYATTFRSDTLALDAGSCLGLAGSPDRWLTATYDEATDEIGMTLWSSSIFGEPTEVVRYGGTFPRAGPEDWRRIALTPFGGDRFAWVVTGVPGRVALVGTIHGDFVRADELRVADVPATPGGAAIAPWGFDPDQPAIAAWAGGLRVIVIDFESGLETVRTEPLVFGMFSDTRPALAPVDDAMIVAAKGYGDIDPFGGLLEVVAIDRRGEELSRLTFETRRNAELNEGIAIATDGRRAILHWSDVIEDEEDTPQPVTRAMIVQCAAR